MPCDKVITRNSARFARVNMASGSTKPARAIRTERTRGEPTARRRGVTAPRVITSEELREQAMVMRRSGATYGQIARVLNITDKRARHLVKSALNRIRERLAEDAEEIVRLELDRLDHMLVAVYPAASRGDLRAVDRVLAIMERRARLLGLDAPDGAPSAVAAAQAIVIQQYPEDANL